jgi:DNA invertase Pin-like site-specific DNA recombinase
MDGYVRVSRVGMRRGDRFISPSVQREQIAGWARLNETCVLTVFEELDASGGRADRPLLEHALQRIEDGVSDGLIVAKVDRFGRSLVNSLLAIRRIQQAGGRFVAVADGLDAGTDAGRLVLRIMLSMAEFELERQRTGFEIAKARAIERGLYIGAHVPVGYAKTPSGHLTPDPRTARLITQLYKRRAAGESIETLRSWLESRGVRTAKGNPGWSGTTTRNLLKRRVYLGEVFYGRYVREGAHPALTDPVTWEVAQRPRYTGPNRPTQPTLLRGLVRCASCGMSLGMGSRPRGGYYCCRCHSAAGACPAPAYISAFELERRVEAIVFDLLGRRRERTEAPLRTAQKRADAAHRSLAAYRDSPEILNALGQRAFADGLAVRTEDLKAARLDVATIRSSIATQALPPTSHLEREWPWMSIEQRRAVILAVIDCVFVRPGRLDYDRRISICPGGTGPKALPRPGDKHTTIRSYPHQSQWLRPYERPLAVRRARRALTGLQHSPAG